MSGDAKEVPMDPYTFGPDQTCFGCGPHNDHGLKLKFFKTDTEVISRFMPEKGYEGPPGVFHGGLQAMVLDEIGGWALVGLRGRMGFTTGLQMRYLRPVRVGVEIEIRASLKSEHMPLSTLNVALFQGGKRCSYGTVTYMLPSLEKAQSYLGDDMPEEWHYLFSDDV